MDVFLAGHQTSTLLSCVVATLVAIGFATTARAHPHVFVEVRTEIQMSAEGLMTGLKQRWFFDEGYAATALEGLDVNGDGQYSAAELEPLTKVNIESLREYDYFTLVRFKNVRQAIADVDLKHTTQVFENGQLSLELVVPLKKPVDPRDGVVAAKIFDPEFFIAFDYAKSEPVKLAGRLPAGCKANLEPLPTEEELDEKKQFLASKGKDWEAPPDQEFGELFAQPLVVKCVNS